MGWSAVTGSTRQILYRAPTDGAALSPPAMTTTNQCDGSSERRPRRSGWTHEPVSQTPNTSAPLRPLLGRLLAGLQCLTDHRPTCQAACSEESIDSYFTVHVLLLLLLPCDLLTADYQLPPYIRGVFVICSYVQQLHWYSILFTINLMWCGGTM